MLQKYSIGGVIYTCPKYSFKSHFQFINWWTNFFNNHEEYRIIHGHLMGSASVYLSIAKRYNRIAISHSHNIAETKLTLYYAISRLYQLPIRAIADYYFACSKEAGEYLFGEKAIKTDRFHIVENGIDSNRFSYSVENRLAIRNKYDIGNRFTIGNVARLYYQKNYPFLISITKAAVDMGCDIRCLIVGTGPEMELLKAQCKEYDISKNVIFAGPHNDPESYYCAMDAFVCPSHFEGLSIATVEAQSTGLISFVSEGVPDRADIKAGLYKKRKLSDGPKKWAEEILKHMKYERKSRSDEIIKAGFDIKRTAQKLQDFYLSL